MYMLVKLQRPGVCPHKGLAKHGNHHGAGALGLNLNFSLALGPGGSCCCVAGSEAVGASGAEGWAEGAASACPAAAASLRRSSLPV